MGESHRPDGEHWFDPTAPPAYPPQPPGWSQQPPPGWPPQGPPPPGPPPARPSRAVGYVLVGSLVALLIGYGCAVVLTRPHWQTPAPRDGIRVTFAASTPDGSGPSSGAVAATRDILQSRADDLAGAGAQVVADGDRLIVTLPETDETHARAIGESEQLAIRPVIHAIPAQSGPTVPTATPSAPPPAPVAQRIADEKALRQSPDPQIQILALQFEATRCNDVDQLAGHDDPALPLVTCSQDHQQVYLLAPSIIGGGQIADARSSVDQQLGTDVVDVEFDGDAARVWADFTAAHVGTQTAFTLNTRVISAPMINEAIPGGRTQISGQFTADSARDLAIALRHGGLPVSLTFEASTRTSVPATPGSTPLRIALLVGAVVLVLYAGLVVLYLVLRRRHAVGRPGPDDAAPAWRY